MKSYVSFLSYILIMFLVSSFLPQPLMARVIKSQNLSAKVLGKGEFDIGLIKAKKKGESEFVRAEELHYQTLLKMYQSAMLSYRTYGVDKFTWLYQAEFAGQLLGYPALFPIGRALLEEAHEGALKLQGGQAIDDKISVLKTVVEEMGRHPDLREQALEIILDPKTYEYDVEASWYIESQKDWAPFAQMKGSLLALQSPKDELQTTNENLSERDKSSFLPLKSFRTKLKKIDVVKKMRKFASFKKVLYDPKLLRRMDQLVTKLLINVGDDLVFTEKLIDFKMQLTKWYRDSESRYRYDYFASEIRDMKLQEASLPKATELALLSEEPSDKGNALMEVVRKYLEFDNIEKALEIFFKTEKVSFISYNSVIEELVSKAEDKKAIVEHIKEKPLKWAVEWLVIAADVLYQKGHTKYAIEVYQDAWSLSEKRENHFQNVVESFIRVAREKELKFGTHGSAKKLLDQSLEEAKSRLARYDRYEAGAFMVFDFAQEVIFELGMVERYQEAEEMVLLVDQKARIEKWGAHQAHLYRADERDKAYKFLVLAASHQADYHRIKKYLDKMDQYLPETTLQMAEILAKKGDYENSFFSSLLASVSVDERGIDVATKNSVTSRVSFVSQGETLFKVARIMADQGGDLEIVSKMIIKSTEMGLGSFELEKVIKLIRDYKDELGGILLTALKYSLEKNHAIIKHNQHAIILEALREFFPQLIDFEDQELSFMSDTLALPEGTSEVGVDTEIDLWKAA